MLDGEPKLNTHAHVAGLKRLSRRASALPLVAGGQARKVAFSFSDYGRRVIQHLKQGQVEVAPGLSEEEFDRIEAIFRFTFPPDLRGILREGLPVGLGFPDWRRGAVQQLQLWINLPITGLCSDVERGSFWWKQWGPRPESTDKAAQMARTALKKVPILIPVYGHCFIPAQPNHAGNPIFFVYRKEISYCGLDVADFMYRTDFVSSQFNLPTSIASEELQEENRLKNGKDQEHQPAELPSVSVFPENNAWRRSEAESSCNGLSSDSRDLDASGWRLEGSDGSLETWGRNLDALVRNPQLFSRRSMHGMARKSEASREGNTDATRPSGSSISSLEDSPRKSVDSFCLQEQLPSSEAFMQFSKTGSTLAAKIARRIEFWSDVVDRRQRSNKLRNGGSIRSLSSDQHEPTAAAAVEDEDNNALAELKTGFTQKWLAVILEDVSTRLRQGGWKEEDISEIVDVFSSPKSSHKPLSPGTQSPSENLALQLDIFSASLRKAGWSIQDVAEALSFDHTPNDHTIRACTKVPPDLSAIIVPLAQSVANS